MVNWMAMRRVLVESARRKQRIRHGGEFVRVELEDVEIAAEIPADEILAVNEALDQLESVDEQAAKLTKLRYFAGMTVVEFLFSILAIAEQTYDIRHK